MSMQDADDTSPITASQAIDAKQIKQQLQVWALALGFQQLDISNTTLDEDEQRLQNWLDNGMQADMTYMAAHGIKRTRPAELVPGTISVISVRINYLTEPNANATKALRNTEQGYISRYALGRDYHKLIRKKLQKLANKLSDLIGPFGYRVFTDSAPVMERALARKAGLGWVGKHTNLIERHTGSWFFLGEIYTDLELPISSVQSGNYCGSCTACLDICPTQAIVAPYVVDARRCISYQTIENKGAIPHELREGIGNRVFGCDDCQLICPWNRYAKLSTEPAFTPREALKNTDLLELFSWSKQQFESHTLGSPIRRISYEQWLRNIAVAIGNAPKKAQYRLALKSRLDHASPLLKEHLEWALCEQAKKRS